MQVIKIQTDITRDGHIYLPPPLRNLYGRQARLILLFDETSSLDEPPTFDQLCNGPDALMDEQTIAKTIQVMDQEMEQHWHETWHSSQDQVDSPGLNQNALVQKIVNAFPNVLAVYAFGSRMDQSARLDSDLDLAVLLEESADPMILWSLAGELGEISQCPVDLLDLRAASTVMQYQVITTGTQWLAIQPQVGLFECFVMSEKTDLDEARADLLAEIQQEGVVYAR
ncbi:MAG: nucleotidyltransferase domain-containing protein [Magnetococcus sp. YQC-5]